MEEQVKIKLDELADLQLGQDALRLQKQEEIDKVITPAIKAMLSDIDDQFEDKEEVLRIKIEDIVAGIQKAVLEYGKSVKGSRLHAVWSKGRVSWNTKALDGYAAGHPEISQFRTEGEPSVGIRQVKV